jgi:hypothetical protein
MWLKKLTLISLMVDLDAKIYGNSFVCLEKLAEQGESKFASFFRQWLSVVHQLQKIRSERRLNGGG